MRKKKKGYIIEKLLVRTQIKSPPINFEFTHHRKRISKRSLIKTAKWVSSERKKKKRTDYMHNDLCVCVCVWVFTKPP